MIRFLPLTLIIFIFQINISSASSFQKANITVDPDTSISEIISEINADSVRSHISQLQALGTRFCLAANNRSVAVWVKNKFISYGYNNARLDSFQKNNPYAQGTLVWQYNVIASLEGLQNPEKVYVMCAHFDNYSGSASYTNAPGADDNASGCAAAFEVARIIKTRNYQPNFTIEFALFDGEELGLWGSRNYAQKSRNQGRDIVLAINNDMISYNPDTANKEMTLEKYPNSGWATSLAHIMAENYTNLSIIETTENIDRSDSWEFFDVGYNTVFFEEDEFTPYYHTINDNLSSINPGYCAEITKVSCAMLLHLQKFPQVMNVKAFPFNDMLKISWKKNIELNVAGYNVYKSLSPNGSYTKINTTPLPSTDTTILDSDVIPLTYYYYAITSVNSQGIEGALSNYDSSMVILKNQGVLIVDDSQNELLNPHDTIVDNFYSRLLSGYPVTHYNAIGQGAPDLAELGKYNAVFWHTDRYTGSSKFMDTKNEIKKYLSLGGKLLFTCERFAATIDRNLALHDTYLPGDFVNTYIGADSMYRVTNSKFFSALPYISGFPDLSIDTTKTPATNSHHLIYPEAIFPEDGSQVVYSYGSEFTPGTSGGMMIGLPVGILNSNTNFQALTLSFPLWYIKENEASALVSHVFNNVFNLQTSEKIPEFYDSRLISVFPNPSNNHVFVRYFIASEGNATLLLCDITGKVIMSVQQQSIGTGVKSFTLNLEHIDTGLYFVSVVINGIKQTTKLVVKK